MRCELPDFTLVFRIPAEHRLEPAGALSRGGRVHGLCWFHREYDRGDRLVARYETYDEVGAEGGPRCGWRRYDSEGRLTQEREVAMRWSSLVAAAPSRRAAEAALQCPAGGEARAPELVD
jgi:hypothetical protein